MKISLPSKLLSLILAISFFTNTANAGVEPVASGSFIVNMGVVPQTYANGIKPWGMVWDLIHNYKVNVKWVINQSKIKDGTDFNYNGTDYKGGTFIIPQSFRTAAVNARITYWQSQGVVGTTTTSVFNVDITYTLKYTPRWTFDFQNGNIAINYLDIAGIPDTEYPKKYPDQLNGCDDLFVMPHAEPTWATHKNLLYWNKNTRGWLWYGCHAGSVVENLSNPLDPTERMNFLSANGLVADNQHGNGTPPYTYTNPTDPEMQFMGIVDAACQNGAEQVYLPLGANGWRPTTKVSVSDPTQQNMPTLSTGPAAIIVYGRGFGDNTRGKVMMQAGHNFDKGNADAVAEIRAFFNFSFLSVYDKSISGTIVGPTLISGNAVNYTLALPADLDPTDYAYHWSSTCGTFSNAFALSTTFIPTMVSACTPCTITVTITDGCGREYYETLDMQVCPTPPVAQDITTAMIINAPGTGAQKIGKNFPLAGTDADGIVVNYIIKTLPASGLLSYDADNNPATPDAPISSLPAGGLILTKTQANSIKYDPVDGFSNNTSFTYTVTDNSGLLDLTPATYTIPVDPPPIAKTFICVPAASTTNLYNVCPMEATDEGTIVTYTVVTLPVASQGKVYLLGVELDPGQVLSPLQISLLTFKPGGAYVGYAEITYTATDEKGISDLTPATLTLQLVNQPPAANDVSAPTITNPVGAIQVNIPNLSATDVDGSIASYMITNIPTSAMGKLYLNSVAVNNNQVLTLAQAGALKFDPKDNFSGVAKFYFTATDNDGLTDNTPATYSIPVKDILPNATNITNTNINAAAGLTAIKPLLGSDPDSTNIITKFIVTQLPAANEGVLYYNSAGSYVPVVVNQEMTPAQGTTLKFDPQLWLGNSVFRFTVKDDEGFIDPTSATFTIPLVNTLPKVVNITSTPMPDTAAAQILTPGLSGTDEDGTVTSFIITSLPNPSTGVLRLRGSPVALGTMISAADAQILKFNPTLHNDVDGKFKFASVDNLLGVANKDATYTIKINMIPYKNPPVASPVVNAAIPMKAVVNNMLPLSGTDADGVVTSYEITQLPPANQGKMFLQGVPVISSQVVPADKADELTFIPSGTFKGTATFKYTCDDNDGLTSNEVNYQVIVANAKPVATNISIQPVKKGTTTLVQGLQATDADGTVVSFRILSLPTLSTLQYDSAGIGNYINIPVNRVLTPAQASRLRVNASNVVGTATFNYSAKDDMNDTSSVAVYTIPVSGTAGNQYPVANNIISAAISYNSGLALISPLTASDLDGTIASYTLIGYPPVFYGTLYYNVTGTTYAPVTYGGFVLTTLQAATLKFQPSGLYTGNVTIKYVATDDDEGTSNYGSITIPMSNIEPVATNITNAGLLSSDGPTLLTPLAGTDDGSITDYFITTLPAANQGILVLDGIPVEKQQIIPLMYINRLEFDPDPSFTGTATFKFSAKDNLNAVDQTPATFSIPVSNDKPVADDKLSQVITNQPGTIAQVIPELTGIDYDGNITSFLIQSLPAGGQLYKNGTLISSIPVGGYTVSTNDASKLSFDPNENWSGTASFTYTVKDNSNNLSAIAAVYQIPVNLPPVTSNVNAPPFSAGSARSSIPSLVGSDDGAVAFFTITAIPPSSAGYLYVNNVMITDLAQVDSLNATQITQLSFQPTINFGGAIFTYTATDNQGVIDVTPAVYRIPMLNLITLPVELLSFTGKKFGEDNLLEWATSQETNSDHFELEYSADGQNFTSITEVAASGSSTVTTNYNYVHTQVQGKAAYYRLKMYDKNMDYKYSNIVVIKRTAASEIYFSVYPNPFSEKVTISIVAETNSKVEISLFDLVGKLIKTIPFQLQKGTNKLNIDQLGKLVTGTYMLSITNQEMHESTKLLKVN